MGFGRITDLPKKKNKNKNKKLDHHIVNRLRDSQSQLPQRPQQNNKEKETHLCSPDLVSFSLLVVASSLSLSHLRLFYLIPIFYSSYFFSRLTVQNLFGSKCNSGDSMGFQTNNPLKICRHQVKATKKPK